MLFAIKQWVKVRISVKPDIINDGSVNLPLTFSQVFTVAGLVTDGLAVRTPSGYWVRAYTDYIHYAVVSTNQAFSSGDVEAIVIGR